MTLTVTLTEDVKAIVDAYAARQGSTPEAAVEDLIRRGAAHVEWREIRESVEDIRSTALDTFAALDVLAPYTLATLQLLAHWAARTGSTKLDEVAYAEEARAVGRASWESQLAALGIAPDTVQGGSHMPTTR
jgi:hypothetical protein